MYVLTAHYLHAPMTRPLPSRFARRLYLKLDGGITCSGLDFAVEMKNWSRRSSETCESLISDSGDRRATIKMRYHHYHHFQPDAISGGIGLPHRTAPHRTTPFSPPLRKVPPHLSPHSHSPAIARLQPAPDASSQKGLGDTFTPLRVWCWPCCWW